MSTPQPLSAFQQAPAPGEGTPTRMVKAWDRFWFRPADPLPLGLIRICTGLVILYVHLVYTFDLMALVGPHAWVDSEVMTWLRNDSKFYPPATNWTSYAGEPSLGMPVWSVYFHATEPAAIVALHTAFLVAMFLFTIGFCTRLTATLTWVGIMSYISRTPTTLFGMDTIMNVVTLYLMIGPSGATLSVDRLIARWWARRQGRALLPPQPAVSANFALRLMQVHFCFIYLASGLSKLQGPSWWNGTALWGTMANYSFAPMNWPAYLAFLKFLCEYRPLWEIIMTGGTYFTLALEISFPFLIWRPKLRWLMIIASTMLHTGIGLVMGLTTFSLFMLCLLLAFVPPETVHAFVAAIRAQGRSLVKMLKGRPREERKQAALVGQA